MSFVSEYEKAKAKTYPITFWQAWLLLMIGLKIGGAADMSWWVALIPLYLIVANAVLDATVSAIVETLNNK